VAVIVYRELWAYLVWVEAVRVRAQAKPILDRRIEQLSSGLDPVEIAPILAADLTNRDTTATVVDRAGRVIGSAPPLDGPPAPRLPEERYAAALAEDPHVTSVVRDPDGRRVLALLIPPLPWRPAPPAVVQLAIYLEDHEKRLHFMRVLAAGLVAIGMLEIFLEVVLDGPVTLVSLAALPLIYLVARAARRGGRPPVRFDRNQAPRPAVEEGPRDLAAVLRRIDAAFLTQQASEDRMRRFLADASHELRTPLTSLGGAADVLLEKGSDDRAELERLARLIRSEADRMAELVEDMLTLARLDAAEARPRERLRLDELAAEHADELLLSAPDRRIELQTAGPAWVLVDADGMRRVLANLTSNAARHTGPGGRVAIGVRVDAGTVTLTVEDDGEGIAEQDVPWIFERFYRSASAGATSGSGLGLAIVREIVRAHAGEVSVESRTGEGATFAVTLPVAGSPAELGRR
jgi:two-component system OmpR family sensor kinase